MCAALRFSSKSAAWQLPLLNLCIGKHMGRRLAYSCWYRARIIVPVPGMAVWGDWQAVRVPCRNMRVPHFTGTH